jgi:AcrR family transcriptional regulator
MPQPPSPAPAGTKRDATRQRLLAAANRRFRELGYDSTTAAAIAEDAGVTERTFFRYFPSKSAVLVANWELHGDALRLVLAGSTKPAIIDVVRDAILAFTYRLQGEIESGLDSVVRLYTDRAAFLAIMETLLGVENEVAAEIGRRSSRSSDDFYVRIAANASLGVMRAAIREFVQSPDGAPMDDMIKSGMAQLRPCFKALT